MPHQFSLAVQELVNRQRDVQINENERIREAVGQNYLFDMVRTHRAQWARELDTDEKYLYQFMPPPFERRSDNYSGAAVRNPGSGVPRLDTKLDCR